ncbi:hypothetical protein FIBSPDRAFT_271355 [Athelia psychrophila]|uniref:Uncharacterized protein n=1 Tax=Athelia psychrophila TaxID=1759441 RepID=A0A165WXA5_9AGAM|nr:hypothetical protein FIBSPDRAFT_271355 [Fibularhizoctonia sp. CBS 109695]
MRHHNSSVHGRPRCATEPTVGCVQYLVICQCNTDSNLRYFRTETPNCVSAFPLFFTMFCGNWGQCHGARGMAKSVGVRKSGRERQATCPGVRETFRRTWISFLNRSFCQGSVATVKFEPLPRRSLLPSFSLRHPTPSLYITFFLFLFISLNIPL